MSSFLGSLFTSKSSARPSVSRDEDQHIYPNNSDIDEKNPIASNRLLDAPVPDAPRLAEYGMPNDIGNDSQPVVQPDHTETPTEKYSNIFTKEHTTPELQLLQSESDRQLRNRTNDYRAVEKMDRLLEFFSPAKKIFYSIPVIGQILEFSADFMNKYKSQLKLVSLGELIFKLTEQMTEKIGLMESTYELWYNKYSKPNQPNEPKKNEYTPDDFIRLNEHLEELYLMLLNIVLSGERINNIAKQLQAKNQYAFQNKVCNGPYSSGCSLQDKILLIIDNRQTISPRLNTANSPSVASYFANKLKRVGTIVYRYGIGEVAVEQLRNQTQLVSMAFNIATSQFALDLKKALDSDIKESKDAAFSKIAELESKINLPAIRQSVSDTMERASMSELTKVNKPGGYKTTRKMRQRRTMKLKQGGKTHRYRKQT